MKYILYTFMFILIGEIIFEIDYYSGVNKIMDIKSDLTNGNAKYSNHIYLLGDSYTKGLGITKQHRMASLLALPEYSLIDSSHSGDNWAEYFRILKSIDTCLKEKDVIVIGVNWNDIDFNKGSIMKIYETNNAFTNSISTNKLTENTSIHGMRSFFHLFYGESKLVNFLSTNIQNTLKRKGIPLPIGDFQYFRKVAYKEKKEELLLLLNYIENQNIQKKTNTILYLMPDFNLTKRLEYFEDFRNFFNVKNQFKTIQIIDGPLFFFNAPDGYYCLSIHDGHPNCLAHIQMAQQINYKLKQLYQVLGDK